MPAARWTGALIGALATACLLAAPAFADSCGNPGYSYAGLVTSKQMKGVRSKYKEFALKPDFVVSPKLGANLQNYIQDFRKVTNAP